MVPAWLAAPLVPKEFAMPEPLGFALRQRIYALWQHHVPAAAIAAQLRLCPRTVRHLCQAFRRRGPAALLPAYPAPRPPALSPALQQALLLHAEHPSWGAPFLLLRLRQLQPRLSAWPSPRTLQRWFRRLGQPPAPPGRKPAARLSPARQPHDVWQIDAVDQLRLATGQQVSWLRCVDELTGAVLGTTVFPPGAVRPGAGDRGQSGPAAALAPLGAAPGAARRQRLPVGQLERPADPFALWLVGLGIDLHWNDPGRPQQNPKVERAQGTGQRWGEPGRCRDAAELQANLDIADRIHREDYPTPGGAAVWSCSRACGTRAGGTRLRGKSGRGA
jgi:hypothetical protein